MTTLLGLGVSVLVFGIIIIVHEFGHFFVAKSCGVRVEEFSIGMGPLLFSRRGRDGTLYSLRLLPLGGYNLMDGGEEEQARPGEKQPVFPVLLDGKSIRKATVWERVRIFAAGPLMNLLLGFAILLILICRQDVITSKVIYSVEENAACAVDGLQAGDEILAVNGRHCFVANDIMYELSRTSDYTAEFTVLRDGQRVVLPSVHFDTVTSEDGAVSMQLGFTVYGIHKNVLSVLKETVNTTIYYARIILRSLTDLLSGRESINNISGPVGAVSAISQAASYGLDMLLSLAALLSVNVCIFNLLPIPGLDGCKLLILLVEAVTRRPVPERVEMAINAIGMAALLTLVFFATWQDLLRLF